MMIKAKFFPRYLLCLALTVTSGCENSNQNLEPASEVDVLETVETVAAPVVSKSLKGDLRPPLNCRVMIVATSQFWEREEKQFLSFGLEKNPDFDPAKEDACDGDIKNLWPDLMRFDDEIESHLPNVKGWFDAHLIMDKFPTTELELKHFIDQASKTEGLPERLDQIDRSTLEGGLEYQGNILTHIRQQEKLYWQTVHGSVVDEVLSDYGDIQYQPGSEKHAYCYHPHKICRGYARYYNRIPESPKNRIGVESEYDLEYLWSGFWSYHFDFEADDESSKK